MRNELKSVFSKEIILEDGGHYFFVIQPYEMKNMLGAVITVLDEYLFTKSGTSEIYKLYRTKEGNWYEIENDNTIKEGRELLALKRAINNKEINTTSLTK